MSTDFLTQIVQHKGREISRARKVIPEGRLAEQARQRTDFRPFYESLSRPGDRGVNIIAEIKRASPSKGDISPDLDAADMASAYEKGGAAAVSVLIHPLQSRLRARKRVSWSGTGRPFSGMVLCVSILPCTSKSSASPATGRSRTSEATAA